MKFTPKQGPLGCEKSVGTWHVIIIFKVNSIFSLGSVTGDIFFLNVENAKLNGS